MARKMLTDEEYNAISHYTHNTQIDDVFDIFGTIQDEDFFIDYEENELINLEEGLAILADMSAYPLIHDVSLKNAKLIHNLMKEFGTVPLPSLK